MTKQAMLFGILLLLTADLESGLAAVVTQPDSVAPGEQYRLVYTTSFERTGSSSSIDSYNLFVNDIANNLNGRTGSLIAGLGTWTAIASAGGTNARQNTLTDPILDGPGVPIYNLSGELLASDYQDFWDGLLAANIDLTERGTTPPSTLLAGARVQQVATGSSSAGFPSLSLGSGTITYGAATIIPGNPFADSWVAAGSTTAGGMISLYGMSETITAVAIPEPSQALLLSAIAIIGLLAAQRRRRNRIG